MVKNKGQMKIQQMAFMLMAVTLLFVLVGLFVLTFSFSGLKESAAALEEKNALLLVTKLANSPEFSCGNSFGPGRINCIDGDKMMILRDNSGTYSGFWGNDISNIEVRKIVSDSEVLCNKGNYPNCNVIRLYSGELTGTAVSNFVSLCRKEVDSETGVYDECEIARVFVNYVG